MKGIVFNLLEEVVQREYGEDAWDALLEAAELEGAYTSLGTYGDGEMQKLVAAASALLQKSPEEILEWFGYQAIPLLADKYPEFFAPHDTTRSFLLTLNQVIHPEVRKIYPGADVPVFDFDLSTPDAIVMEYRSARRLCSFAAGLIRGAAERYGEQVALEHPKCASRGDESCLFKIALTSETMAA